jgi:hypothetical protein
LTETYTWDQFQGYVRFRYDSGGYYLPPTTATFNDNFVPAQYYFDLGASYYLSDDKKYQVYANVVNLANRPPPFIPVPTFYDIMGRTYNVGARVSL